MRRVLHRMPALVRRNRGRGQTIEALEKAIAAARKAG